jgi:hypothetical protein
MTMTTNEAKFSGPYQDVLAELAQLIAWVFAEHDVSFVKAGDDKVYAFGGNGYVLVLDERRWQGLIELLTPKATITIKPGEDGNISVTSPGLDPEAIKQAIREGISGIRNYYEKRYWRTPRTT